MTTTEDPDTITVPRSEWDNILARLEKVELDVAPSHLDLPATLDTYNQAIARLTQQQQQLREELENRQQDAVPADSDALQDMRQWLENVAARVDELADQPAPAPADVATKAWNATPALLSPFGPRPQPGVHAKVLELMQRVRVIEKSREANPDGEKGQPRYQFRGVDEAMDVIGHALRDVGLILLPEVLKSKRSQTPVEVSTRNGSRTVLWTTVWVKVQYTFLDPADGSVLQYTMEGEGKDPSDKATSKAMSMALKYGLFQALMVPVRGLDESDGQNPVIESERPAQDDTAAGEAELLDAARKAVQAAETIHNLRAPDGTPATLAQQRTKLLQISDWCQRNNVATILVKSRTVNDHILAALATFPDPEDPASQEAASADRPEDPAAGEVTSGLD